MTIELTGVQADMAAEKLFELNREYAAKALQLRAAYRSMSESLESFSDKDIERAKQQYEVLRTSANEAADAARKCGCEQFMPELKPLEEVCYGV